MGKLVFNYGCMGSGKTTAMLTKFDSYKRRGKKPIIVKPCIDNREGNFVGWGITKSRITKYEEPSYYYEDLSSELSKLDFNTLFVDEAQFLTKEDVMVLCKVAEEKEVICYGLRTDVNGDLFSGAASLLALADETNEIEVLCEINGCSHKAVAHIRYINGVREKGIMKPVAIETENITYKSVCRHHWMNEESQEN